MPQSATCANRIGKEQTALADLLGEDFAVAQKDTLYRCLDRLSDHKAAFFTYLTERWQSLFAARFDVLLYDLTSTYFECVPPGEGKRQFGYSRASAPIACRWSLP